MGELTPEAKKLIADSIAIVREDKTDAWWRNKVEQWGGGAKPKSDDDPKAPPVKDDPTKDAPTPDDPPKNKSAYWGVWDDET